MYWKKLVIFFILIISSISPLLATTDGTPPNELCKAESYVVGFFNGVWNTKFEANSATRDFKGIIGEKYNNKNVEYETFLNTSGVIDGDGATAFQDIAEVFIQRAEEIELDLGNNFEIFWSAISGDSDGFFSKITNIFGATSNLLVDSLADLYTEISTESAALISKIASNPPTQEDYIKHSTRIKDLALKGNKLLLIAHSQGNLFVNNAYDAAIDIEGYSADNIGIVHIAPASSIVNGPHILANIDVVINGLRVFGNSTVPNVTVKLPFSHLRTDPSGHMLFPTYLNQNLATYVQVKSHIDSEMDRLIQPEQIAEIGAFTVILVWNGSGDVDLHTFEPDGSQVYYRDKTGSVGYLDVDNTVSDGPEHYYASCDPDMLDTGIYKIGINNYAGAEGRTATIQVSTPYIANLYTGRKVLSTERGRAGNLSPEAMATVTVKTNQDGNYEISASQFGSCQEC